MNNLYANKNCLSLLCDQHGKIVKFIRDDFAISHKILPGRAFTDLIDKANLDKAFNFLIELRRGSHLIGH